MSRTTFMVALLLVWLAAPILAQNTYAVPVTPGYVYAPEIHFGSFNQPTTVIVPPVQVEEISATPPQPYVSNAPPASTELLASRHFDFITSPVNEVTPGS